MKADNPLPEHENEENLANEFADYFIGKIEKIRQELNTNSRYTPSNDNIPTLSRFTEVTQDEVQKIIMNLATKNCELDPFPTSILKEVLPALLPTITSIMNASLKLGVFVQKWKVAVIRPLLKKAGLELIPKNYRPVSNLPFLSKVLEQCVLARFNEHCDNHSLLPDYQSAYRPNHSCETSLLKIINDMLWAMERKNVTAMVVMDLSAAFDTVDHDILLSILENKFGIKDVALRWFESYLRPRSCKVSINPAYSAEKQLPFSVPQGSCAGPSLFLAYASTLQEVKSIAEHEPGKHAISLNGFADDHSIKKEFHPAIDNQEMDCITDLEHCMEEVQIWMDKNCLKLNNAKTELILFGSRQTLSKCVTNSININGHEVDRSVTIKYLGAWLDQELKMKQHIVNKCRTAMSNIQKIKYLRPILTEDTTQALVLGLVISHIDYCNSLFAGLPEIDISKLQRIQNAGAKLVLNKPKSYSATEALRQLHWLPI